MPKNNRKVSAGSRPLPPAVWRISYPLLSFLFVAWSAFVLWQFLQRSPVRLEDAFAILDQWTQMHFWHPYLLKGLTGLGVAAWILWCCVQVGQWALERVAPEKSLTGLERMAFGGGIGIGILSNAVLLLGACRLWSFAVFCAGLGAISLLAWIRRGTPSRTLVPPAVPAGPTPWRSVWGAVLVVAAGLWLLGGFSPEIFYDSLHYHLAIPDLYRMERRIFSIPGNMYASYVMPLHFLYGLGITLGNTLTAKFLQLGVVGLMGAAMVELGRRYLSPGAGLLSLVLFFGIPMVGTGLTMAGIDVGWGALQFLAAYAFIRALDQADGPSKRAWLWIAGALTGLAASCKYVGFSFVPIACLLLVWRHRFDERRSWGETLRALAHFSVAAFLLVLPQLIKNIVLSGNPIYPFLGTRWGRPLLDPSTWKLYYNDQNARHLAETFSAWPSAIRFLLHPWHLTFGDASGMGSFGPLCLVALPALFFMRVENAAFRMLRRYSALAWLLWLFTSTVPRYGLPALALASPLFAEALVMAGRSSWVRTALLGGTLVGTAGNLALLMGSLYQTGGWRVVGGLVSESDYLGEMHSLYPTPPYAGIAWANAHLPRDAKILLVGDPRTYYSQRRIVSSCVYGGQEIVKIVRASRDGAGVMRRLREQGITHLILNMGEAVRTSAYDLFPWDASTWRVFEDFWKRYARLAWQEEVLEQTSRFKALYVYELLSEEEAGRPHEVPPCLLARWAPPEAAEKQLK